MGNTTTYYIFLGLHSLLIGLFPFFIPVYLWSEGFSLAHISLFIALTGTGFCLSLYCWDRLRMRLSLRQLISLSFMVEFVLLATFFIEDKTVFLIGCGVMNGVYNCCFWTLQRLFFLEISSPQNTGRNFGNLQLFVTLALKIALFAGGYLLENYGLGAIFLSSSLVATCSIFWFLNRGRKQLLHHTGLISYPLSPPEVIHFRASVRSKVVFAFDGIYLFLESYFWVLTLFFIAQESFWHLALLVVVLTMLLGGLFMLIKNTIDRINRQVVYTAAVLLYVLSWLLRGVSMADNPLAILMMQLALITFCTAVFRLAFNKRFFDQAGSYPHPGEYILFKSYYSQFFIALFFGVLAMTLTRWQINGYTFQVVYLLAGALAAVYFVYPEQSDKR